MKLPYRIVISLLLIGLSLPASAAITARLDRDQIASGESVQLTLQHDGQTDSQPDLSPLKPDFEIAGRSSASSIQIINGKMSSQVQLRLSLVPKHDGKLQIPALQWDGQSSPALTLTVGGGATTGKPGGNAPAGNATHAFITLNLEQKQPYVQAAVPLTLRLYADVPLYQASLDFPPSNDVLIQQLGQDRQTSETRNGRSYQVIERKYLLFPQRSGNIQLAGPVLNAQVQDNRNSDSFGADPFFGNVFGHNPFAGMLNSTRPIRIQGDQIVLNVRPRPSGGTGHDWLPAKNVTLEETWQPDDGVIHAGEPITRHLHLSALGLTAAQLPDLSLLMPLPADMRAYPDQPSLKNEAQANDIVGTRDQDIALIASRPGRYEIPAMHLSWWDTSKNVQREINLPAHTLNVLPNTAAFSTNTVPPGPGSADSGKPPVETPAPEPHSGNAAMRYRWDWISLTLALLWSGTLAAWWYSSRRTSRAQPNTQPHPNETPPATPRRAEARKAFRQACAENDPFTARRHLLEWARATWPQNPPAGLMALAQRLNDSALKSLLNQLDRACYANGEWSGERLLESLGTLSGKDENAGQHVPELAGLYPQS